MTILERAARGIVVFDGAIGTMLEGYLAPGELPELLNLTMPDVVCGVHRAYLDAGSHVVETNTLNANRLNLDKVGRSVEEVIGAAVRCARRAVAESGRAGEVALSMGSLGVMIEPFGALSFEAAYDLYAQMARAGAQAGADLIIIETISDLREAKAAVLAAKGETDLPVAVTLTYFENGKLLTGADAKTCAAVLGALGADIIGLNCGLGPSQMRAMVEDYANVSRAPILVNPNAGMPALVDGKSVYAVAPDAFAEETAALVQLGARLVGGCCGTTPAHIRALTSRIAELDAPAPKQSARCVVASGAQSVEFAEKPVEICDVSADDIEDMIDSALETHAEIILVEYTPLADAVQALQETIRKPLYLVASSPEEARRALRLYDGAPILGVATHADIDAYESIAKSGGASLAVADEALFDRASDVLGAHRVFVDCGADAALSQALTARGVRTILRAAGAAAAHVTRD
ncbi:MAG: homocysteine S-methyltransferase family protein [Christensenellales bacterium]|jgi:5-methyltetrahydrofolate--homocysteine methyltransferase